MFNKKSEPAEKQNRRRFLDRNSIVFVLSFAIAVILWIGVSMFQTTKVDKTFQGIRVRIPYEGSLPANSSLQIFGESEFTVDVTVSGKSYIINDRNFTDSIDAYVSLSSIREAGTYTLPVTVTCSNSDVEITNVTRTSISIYFDETVERAYPLTEEILEGADYQLPEGYTRENPRLSTDTVLLEGPSLELGRIFAVKATVELNKEVTGTETFQADLVYLGNSSVVLMDSQVPNVTVKNEDPITVTVPVSITTTLAPVIEITGAPAYFRENPVPYTVTPELLTVVIPSNDTTTFNAKEINVGTLDFSEIDNTDRTYLFPLKDLDYFFRDGPDTVGVRINMSDMAKRWLTINVDTTDVKLPDGAEVLTSSISGVQVIGPESSVMASTIGNDEAYAVPVVEGVEWHAGVNTVPVKIYLRTLTDSWVRGEYSVEINVPA